MKKRGIGERWVKGSYKLRRQRTLAGLHQVEPGLVRQVDFLTKLIGFYRNQDARTLIEMAKGVEEDLKNAISSADLTKEDGRLGAIGLQGELRAMRWFSQGQNGLESELHAKMKYLEDVRTQMSDIERESRTNPAKTGS